MAKTNSDLVADLLKRQREIDTSPETMTVLGGMVLTPTGGNVRPLIVSTLDGDEEALIKKLDELISAGSVPLGNVFYEANENLAEAWTEPYEGIDQSRLQDAEDEFKKQAGTQQHYWKMEKGLN